MDDPAAPTEKRPPARSPGAAKSRTTQPTDPRREGATPPANSRGGAAKGAGGTRGQSGTGPGKKAASSTRTRSHSQPASDPQPVDAAVALADIPTLDTAASPLLLPPIVPAQPAPEADQRSGNGNGNGNGHESGRARPLAPWPAQVTDGDESSVALVDPSSAGGGPDGGTSLVPSVHVPTDTATLPALLPSPVAELTDSEATGGLPSLLEPRKPARALRAPVRQRRRPRVRRVTRVVRHVDTWSVFKVALVFNLFLYAVCLTAGVMLWQVAQNTGTVDNIERFFETFGWQTFELKGGEIYHNAWIAGLFVVVGLTGLAVLAATLFNLITDLVGGVRVTVLEEEVVAREERGMGWRRGSRAKAAEAVEPEVAQNPVE